MQVTLLPLPFLQVSPYVATDHQMSINATAVSYRSSPLSRPLQGEEFGPEVGVSLALKLVFMMTFSICLRLFYSCCYP